MDEIKKIDNLKLIVFDLDYTLWPFWVDTHVTPPFRRNGENVYDARGQKIKYYPEVPMILKKLKSLDYKIGIASRTGCIDEANELLKLFDWNQYIDCKEIYPGCKINHIQRLSKKLAVNLNQLIFFDDEYRNINDLNQINVCSILVENGINKQVIKNGFQQFINYHQSSK